LNLVSVYKEPRAEEILYALLAERPVVSRISHAQMPSIDEHASFVRSVPYRWWYLIQVDDQYVGDIHVTELNEIGLFVFKRFHRKGIATRALKLFMEKHKPLPAIPAKRVCRWQANIAPGNKAGKSFFKKHGFRTVQRTMAL
jgi:RimJ/RimL family protein N-acetyltransferase